ncbi:MAG: hypothetical protein ABIQ74_13915 [Chitinophagales bacterium]
MKIFTLVWGFIFSGWLLIFNISCNIINPMEGVPSYLQVDTFTFTVVQGQGSSSSRITDVWVFDESTTLGAYEIPKTFPVLDSGEASMIFSPGIWDNGIAETRIIYPFYYPDTITLDLEPGKILSITPHYSYRSTTKFNFIEDFEAGNLFTLLDGDSGMIRTTDPSKVFEGIASGEIFLNPDFEYYQGRSSGSYNFPENQPVFLELNYKCDQSFQVGLYGIQAAGTVFYYKWTINPRDYWNKIYLDMGSDVSLLGASDYQILVKALFDTTRAESHIYLDNVKLVSF